MNILSIDSSTKNISIAVSSKNILQCEVSDSKSLKHMVNITGFMDKALSGAGLDIKDIDVYGVNTGPGDFTGTRIGVTIIKTLAWAEEKPAFGIDSLDAFAPEIIGDNENAISRYLAKGISPFIMPCLDVRRSEVYFALYSLVPETGYIKKDKNNIAGARIKGLPYTIKKVSADYLVRRDDIPGCMAGITKDKKMKAATAKKGPARPIFIVGGNYYNSYKDIFTELAGKDKSIILTRKTIYPKARHLNAISYFKMINGSKPENLMPAYVREFIPFGG